MRVRPFRTSTDSRRSAPERRPHRPAPRRDEEKAVPEARTEPRLTAEQRVRSSGGPDDQASYQCSCGYVFAADVSTSVSCPHCGTGQAW